MAVFTANYTVDQAADCSTITITDVSDYTDEPKVSFSSRQLYIYKSDGTLYPNGVVIDFSFASYPTDSITIDIDTDYCFDIELVLTPITPVAGSTYTKSGAVPLVCNLSNFRTIIIHQQIVIYPKSVSAQSFFWNLILLNMYIKNAINAADAFDIFSSQANINEGLKMMDNQSTLFNA